jgi:Flp pilus assembly protein TadD
MRIKHGVLPALRIPIHFLIAMLALIAASSAPAYAVYNEPADAAPAGDPDYAAAVSAIKAAHWQTAIGHLERTVVRHPRSADVHNLLGFSYRKTGNLDRSFRHYHQALEPDPDHRGAHEYIGEAWLMRGDVAKAREHLRELLRLCRAECEEYRDLDRAIADFEHAPRRR